MNGVNKMIEALEEYLEKNDLSHRAFAEKCGVGNSTISRLISRALEEPGIDTLRHIARGMGMPFSMAMMLWDGYDPNEPVIPEGGKYPFSEEEKSIIRRGFTVGLPFDAGRQPFWLEQSPEERLPVMQLYKATVEVAEARIRREQGL